MRTTDNGERLAVHVRKAPNAMLHLNLGSNGQGMVYFACEQTPLMTFQSYGLPTLPNLQ